MNKYFILLILLLSYSFTTIRAQRGHTLKFDKQGQFKIAQFTDIHWDENADNCKGTVEIIKSVLKKENPDFVILTGDIICYKPAKAGWGSIAQLFTEAKIPWAVLMGNHDAEQDMTREDIYALLEQQAYYIGDIGPKDIYGTGNFVLPVKASKGTSTAAALYCLDSNDYTKKPLVHGHYDWIHFDQIKWYRSNSKDFAQANNGKPIPSLAYFHIPLPEYGELIKSETYYGEKREGGASSASINSGFFSSILEMGDVMGTFVGHDHDNSFIGIKNEIALAYGRVSGLNAYGGLDRGARIVVMYENQFKFDTWITTAKGKELVYYYPSGISAEEEATSDYLKAIDINVKKQGVKYAYYEYEGKIKKVTELFEKGRLISQGQLDNFSLAPAKKEDYFGFEFNTWIKIPEDGMYKFYSYTDDGSNLYIDDKLVVDNDGSHSARRRDGRIALKAGYHKMRIEYFESYMGESVEIGISSRNIPEMVIPKDMLYLAD